MLLDAYKSGMKSFRRRVPVLAHVLAAYERDEIDSFELEPLVAAAVFGEAIDLPPAVEREEYAARQGQVRFSNTPSAIVEYRSPQREAALRSFYQKAMRGVD